MRLLYFRIRRTRISRPAAGHRQAETRASQRLPLATAPAPSSAAPDNHRKLCQPIRNTTPHPPNYAAVNCSSTFCVLNWSSIPSKRSLQPKVPTRHLTSLPANWWIYHHHQRPGFAVFAPGQPYSESSFPRKTTTSGQRPHSGRCKAEGRQRTKRSPPL